jgi:hypothetical protein
VQLYETSNYVSEKEREREREKEREEGSTCVCVVLASFNNRKKEI